MTNYKLIIPFILQKEGGFSRAKTDSASKNPAPYTTKARDYSQRGAPAITASDWHTNKGITWGTFTSLAPKLGYAINQKNWEVMPMGIWELIFKRGYWDALNLDKLKSQAIANVAADFAWGAGPGTSAKRLQKAVNILKPNTLLVDGQIGAKSVAAINSVNEKRLFNVFEKLKDTYDDELPNQAANQKGWDLRHDELVALSSQYLNVAGAGLLTGLTLFF